MSNTTTSCDFVAGDIVCVTAEDCIHWHKQGLVVHVDPSDDGEGPLKIWFGRECDYLASFQIRRKFGENFSVNPPVGEDWKNQEKEGRVWGYKFDEVEKVVEWDLVQLANRFFPRLHHTVYGIPKDVPRIGGPCWLKDCREKATQLVLFNMWGSVYPAYGCPDCANKFHLKCGDDLPFSVPK